MDDPKRPLVLNTRVTRRNMEKIEALAEQQGITKSRVLRLALTMAVENPKRFAELAELSRSL